MQYDNSNTNQNVYGHGKISKLEYNLIYDTATTILSQGRELLKDTFAERCISNEFLLSKRIGYIEESKEFVKKMRDCGFKDSDLIKSGLCRLSDYGLLTPFAKRIIFPICDINGNIIAYGGRSYRNSNKYPKYINTRETDFYKKGEVFYNFNHALPSSRKSRRIFLVEGFFDVLAMEQIGYDGIIGLCGTAFTQWHAYLIKLMGVKLNCLLDQDSAGQSALDGVRYWCDKFRIKYQILKLDHKDPNESLIKAGSKETFNKIWNQLEESNL